MKRQVKRFISVLEALQERIKLNKVKQIKKEVKVVQFSQAKFHSGVQE